MDSFSNCQESNHIIWAVPPRLFPRKCEFWQQRKQIGNYRFLTKKPIVFFRINSSIEFRIPILSDSCFNASNKRTLQNQAESHSLWVGEARREAGATVPFCFITTSPTVWCLMLSAQTCCPGGFQGLMRICVCRCPMCTDTRTMTTTPPNRTLCPDHPCVRAWTVGPWVRTPTIRAGSTRGWQTSTGA